MIALSRHRIILDQRIALYAMFGVMSLSGIVFIEPAPYDIALLGVGSLALLFGLRIPQKLAPLIFCFVLVIVFGFFSTINSSQIMKSAMHIVTTGYLVFGAIIIAALIAAMPQKTMRHMMNGYIAAALIATVLGLIGYLDLIPGANEKFTLYWRVRGTFKDPNVYAPFIITPLLYLAFRAITNPGKHLPFQLCAALILVAGLFLSFSRGAWGAFAISSIALLPMILMVLPDNRSRLRLLFLALIALLTLCVLLLVLLESSSIAEMFTVRAQLTQSYDVGGRGRFDGQLTALNWILANPFGVGQGEFGRFWGEQSHNVYISQFLFSGWVGGFGYLAVLVLTFIRASIFISYNLATRPYLMVLLASFCGLIFQGFLVDTDHWRHFYFVIAAIWGLTCAPWKHQERHATHTPSRVDRVFRKISPQLGLDASPKT